MSISPGDLLAEPIRRSLWRMGWTSLRPLQEQAIGVILGGEGDAILSAKTAAGKTEAAFLPVLSKICEQPYGSIRALYVGPLKALINDQFRRLEELCEYAEIPVHRWHGDVSADKKRKLVERPGGVLLITPESLESLFVNRSAALGKIFHSLSFVVIDELHALLGKERGTQLRSQLYRLDRYVVVPPRIFALSATIGDLTAAARWLRPDAAESVHVVRDESGTKQTRYKIHAYQRVPVSVQGKPDPELVPPDKLYQDMYENYRASRNLIFANSKTTVEELTDRLNTLSRKENSSTEFLIHHGSLSREIREDAEKRMLGSRPQTIVCSSTLELGIDIGNVSSVAQVGPCWSVSSLVQRLGRSGRRDEEPHQMRIFIVEDPVHERSSLEERLSPRLLQSIALTELMLKKWVESPNTNPFDFSTLVQQTLSIIVETGGLQADVLFVRLVKNGAFRFLTQLQFATFLRELAKHDLIEQHPDGTLILGLAGEKTVKNHEFYAAFLSPPEYRVLCGGRVIGRLSCDCIPKPEDHLLLAGRRWQVMHVDHDREELLVQPARGRKPPLFPATGGDIATEIRQQMKQLLCGMEVPAYIDEEAKKLFSGARLEANKTGLTSSSVIRMSDGKILWFPWTGSRVMRTLDLLFQWGKIPAEKQSSELSFECSDFNGEFPHSVRNLLKNPPSSRELAECETHLAHRKWDGFVPKGLLVESYAADSLDVEDALKCLREMIAAEFKTPESTC